VLFIRFCSALISAYVFALYLPDPATLLWRLTPCAESWEETCEEEHAWYAKLATGFKVLAGCLWLAAWALLELAACRRSGRQRPRLLTHLRYGPAAVLVLSFAAILASDALLIQRSRWQIVRYIHGDAPPRERPSFDLHNNYRHWCGNGYVAQEYYLYGATPAAHFDHPDPAVRARALHASISVYDGLNNPGTGPSIEVLRKAANDPDPLVRGIAAEYQSEVLGAPN